MQQLKNIFKTHKVLFISVGYLFIVLGLSYFSAYIFPLLYKYTNCCYWLFRIGLSLIVFSLLLLLLVSFGLNPNGFTNFKLSSLSKRLRLKKFTKKEAYSALKTLFFIWLLEILLKFIADKIGISLFDNFAYHDEAVNAEPSSYVFYVYIFAVIIAILSEEIFWRGYLLPFQEKN